MEFYFLKQLETHFLCLYWVTFQLGTDYWLITNHEGPRTWEIMYKASFCQILQGDNHRYFGKGFWRDDCGGSTGLKLLFLANNTFQGVLFLHLFGYSILKSSLFAQIANKNADHSLSKVWLPKNKSKRINEILRLRNFQWIDWMCSCIVWRHINPHLQTHLCQTIIFRAGNRGFLVKAGSLRLSFGHSAKRLTTERFQEYPA